MAFSLLPKEYEFFNLLDALAAQCVLACEQFELMVTNSKFDEEEIKKFKEIEKQGDRTTYGIVNKLNKTFITPLDREDIHELAHELDSVIDLLLKLANIMKLYQVDKIDEHFISEMALVKKAVLALQVSVGSLRNMKDIDAILKEIALVNDVENDGDQLRNDFIGYLFTHCTDAIYIMKWKDIFTTSEKLLDQCDDVAKIIESIVVKQA